MEGKIYYALNVVDGSLAPDICDKTQISPNILFQYLSIMPQATSPLFKVTSWTSLRKCES
jgi:hypothetical protein